jgi:2,3-bisphosphoglycerate-dependent phosphoglycerate mutase
MKELLLLFSGLTFFLASGQDKENLITKVIVVRHAEKANDRTKNPSLSEEGQNRAKRLSAMLKDVIIDEAYSTSYKRTTQTLTPLSEAKNIEIKSYDALNPTSVEQAVKNGSGKTIIVVGHSNTVPSLVNKLIKENKFSEMHEDDYGKMWVLTFKNNQLVDTILLNY